MSMNPRAPRTRSAAPPKFQFAAHTEGANVLAEKLFHGTISQEAYDAQTYSTTIASRDRAVSIPVVLSMHDSLATLIAYAHERFEVPIAKEEATKLYVLWSEKIFITAGEHTVPENLVMVNPGTLNMILNIMKASRQVEHLLVQFGGKLAEARASESTAVEAKQAEAEDNAPTPREGNYSPPNSRDRGSPNKREQSTSSKGKQRERSPEVDRFERDSVKRYKESLDQLAGDVKRQANSAKQQDTQREPQARKENRKPESSSGASKASSKGHSKEKGHGSGRSGR